jgi:hypothetical protein
MHIPIKAAPQCAGLRELICQSGTDIGLRLEFGDTNFEALCVGTMVRWCANQGCFPLVSSIFENQYVGKRKVRKSAWAHVTTLLNLIN